MPPPDDGNEYLPFVDLIKVERLDDNTFKSIALPFTPGGADGSHGAAYGGHVYMQAAWAACNTVAEGFIITNVTGNFIQPGLPTVPFVYTVQRIRDGRSYSTRIVTVTQREGKGIMFTCTCVFKKAETSPLDVQARVNIWEKYRIALGGKKPGDLEECSGMEVPWYWKRQRETGENDAFPGLDSRKAPMDEYNQTRHPLDRRQMVFYRSLGTLPRDPNMHLCAQLYASDRSSLFIVANAFEIGDVYTGIGSLVHSVIFHTGWETMDFGEDLGPEHSRWFCKEDWTTRKAGGRGVFYSRVWSPEGMHVATITQDGMVRLPRGSDAQVAEIRKQWEHLPEEETQRIGGRKEKL